MRVAIGIAWGSLFIRIFISVKQSWAIKHIAEKSKIIHGCYIAEATEIFVAVMLSNRVFGCPN